jgi:proton glutamate symport protein
MVMGRTGRVLCGLVGGIGLGVLLKAFASPEVIAAAQQLQPLGQLWLNALQMSLVPLVFCLMVCGVAAVARTTASGRMLGSTIGVFAGLLVLAGVLGVLLAWGLMALWPLAPTGRALLHAPVLAPQTPGLIEQLLGFVPVNPVAAAANGTMTPLVVFSAIFGAALASVRTSAADALLDMLKSAGDALLVIIGWVLRAAPVGVFLLALSAILHVGLGLAAGLLHFLAMLCIILVLGIVAAMLIGAYGGGVGLRRFAGAAFAPQALAVSTQSSMACLPVLLRSARERLGLPEALVDAVLPLAVSTFRFGNVLHGVSTALVAAWFCGLHPGPGQIALAIGVTILTNVGVVGVPGAAVVFAAFGPAFLIMGAPIELIALLLAVYTVPDILDTTANVTADLAATAVVARLNPQAAEAVLEP